MNNENEIERMAKIVYDNYLDSKTCARELQANGIGDKKQAVKEFSEKLKNTFYVNLYNNETANKIVDDLMTELYGETENGL